MWTPKHIGASWMYKAATREACDRAIQDASYDLITTRRLDFDTIAFTGVSGALFASVLAHVLGKEIICVRKEGHDTHSDCDIEGHAQALKYLIVDDIVGSGGTVKRIIKRLLREVPKADCIGVYTYNAPGYGINGFAGYDVPAFRALKDAAIREYIAPGEESIGIEEAIRRLQEARVR